MYMTPLQELTKKIQAHNPELLELSFGCEIVVSGIAKDNPGCERDVVLYGTQAQWDKGLVPTEYYGQVPRSEIEEIIGHPISLEHVLKAIEKSPQEFPRTIHESKCMAMDEWHFTKPLHEQSEDVITWLNTIIV